MAARRRWRDEFIRRDEFVTRLAAGRGDGAAQVLQVPLEEPLDVGRRDRAARRSGERFRRPENPAGSFA
jgi:hypothetical protein